MLTTEQISASNQAAAETLLGLTNKAFAGVEKLIELNLQVARATLGEVADTTRAVLSAKDAQEVLSLQAGVFQPAAEKAAAYSRQLYDIAAATGAEVRSVAEATGADVQSKFNALVESSVKNAPAGTENVVALVKSTVAAANNAFESAQKAAKQASDAAEANFQAATATAVKSATSTRSKRAA